MQWCRNGDSGLRALQPQTALVLLDLMLPDVDGLALCWSIRHHSTVPILILSARDDMRDRVLGLDAGADDYVVKPFAVEEVLARMRALSRRPRAATANDMGELVVGRIHLSESRHTVTVHKLSVDLSTREFALLCYLMQNRDIVLTRDMILERVWGWGFGGSANVVDVYIRYLRQKVPWHSAGVELTTVRGIGYVLRPVNET